MKFFSATIAALACSSQVFGAPFERRDILSSVTAALNRELGHIRSEVSALSETTTSLTGATVSSLETSLSNIISSLTATTVIINGTQLTNCLSSVTAGGVSGLTTTLSQLGPTVSNLQGALTSALSNPNLTSLASQIEGLEPALNGLVNSVTGLVDNLLPCVTQVAPGLAGNLGSVVSQLGSTVQGLLGSLGGLGGTVDSVVGTALGNLIP